MIIDINSKENDGTRAEYRANLASWVNRIRHFSETFGKDYVPLDIRFRCVETEEELGMTKTVFGEDNGMIIPYPIPATNASFMFVM
jgi:hypothetical protein